MLTISETAQKLVDYARSLDYWEFFRSENARCLIVCLLDGAEEVSMTKYGPRHEKTCLLGFGNNTGADQPAHQRSLISAFVFTFLESITSKLVTSEISTF